MTDEVGRHDSEGGNKMPVSIKHDAVMPGANVHVAAPGSEFPLCTSFRNEITCNHANSTAKNNLISYCLLWYKHAQILTFECKLSQRLQQICNVA